MRTHSKNLIWEKKPTLFAGVLTSFLLTMAVTIEPAQAVLTFTDRAAWETALNAPFTTETFDTVTSSQPVVVFDTGVKSTLIGVGTNRVVSSQEYFGQIAQPGNPFGELNWEFPSPVFGFAFDFVSINTITNLVGNFDGGGDVQVNVNSVVGSTSGFIGVIGSNTINSFKFSNASSTDSFVLDNFSFGGGATVPEASSLALFAFGLFGFGLTRRRSYRRIRAGKYSVE